MQYYVIEWDHEEPDEPWKLYLELDSRGCPRRKVEVFRIGLYQPYDDLEEPPMDPRQAAGAEGRQERRNGDTVGTEDEEDAHQIDAQIDDRRQDRRRRRLIAALG